MFVGVESSTRCEEVEDELGTCQCNKSVTVLERTDCLNEVEEDKDFKAKKLFEGASGLQHIF